MNIFDGIFRYPPWLEENASNLPKEELDRYQQQYEYVCEVCRLYDESDDNKQNSRKIMEVMQLMQECGQPPSELVSYFNNLTPLCQK